ncbi:SET domain-containing protein [Phaeodactylibacter luteus]|uniref:SET domain-containing protein n=1 Tax=Phaeodactylibacter luteus TaxID=1564516 RepID=UPI001FECB48B|nr:SET domain-containing protein [Phaeodactylibacter luteus]
MPLQRLESVFYAPSPLGGRGVFTAAPIPEGAIIEICPVIVMPREHLKYLDETGLYDYYFLWGEEDEECAVALGYGSLYNHSYEPNAMYLPDFMGSTLLFTALKDIEAGTEITVNYNGDPEDDEEVWFMAGRDR